MRLTHLCLLAALCATASGRPHKLTPKKEEPQSNHDKHEERLGDTAIMVGALVGSAFGAKLGPIVLPDTPDSSSERGLAPAASGALIGAGLGSMLGWVRANDIVTRDVLTPKTLKLARTIAATQLLPLELLVGQTEKGEIDMPIQPINTRHHALWYRIAAFKLPKVQPLTEKGLLNTEEKLEFIPVDDWNRRVPVRFTADTERMRTKVLEVVATELYYGQLTTQAPSTPEEVGSNTQAERTELDSGNSCYAPPTENVYNETKTRYCSLKATKKTFTIQNELEGDAWHVPELVVALISTSSVVDKSTPLRQFVGALYLPTDLESRKLSVEEATVEEEEPTQCEDPVQVHDGPVEWIDACKHSCRKMSKTKLKLCSENRSDE